MTTLFFWLLPPVLGFALGWIAAHIVDPRTAQRRKRRGSVAPKAAAKTDLAAVLASEGPYRSRAPSEETPARELIDQIVRLQAENAFLRAELKKLTNNKLSTQEGRVLWALAKNAVQQLHGLEWKENGVVLAWRNDFKLYVLTHSGQTIASPDLGDFIKQIAKVAPFKDWK